MLRCGRSKSFIETHCSSLLWALFIPKKTTKFEMFGFIKFSKPIKPFGRSCLNGLCVWLKPDRIYSFEATSTVQPPRSRSSTGKTKKSKKNWNSIVLQRFEPPGFILRRSVGFQCFLRSRPSSFGAVVKNSECVVWHLIGVWVRGFASALADSFFYAGGPPWVVSEMKRSRRLFFVWCLRQ